MDEPEVKTAQFKDFVRFINSKNSDLKCYVCTHGDWTVLLEEDGVSLAEVHQAAGSQNLTYPTYSLVCVHCGNMHFHMARLVDEWIRDNPAASDNAE